VIGCVFVLPQGVNYALFFWLPDYLDRGLHLSADMSDLLSTFFDVGSIIGGVMFGLCSDPFVRRYRGVGRSLIIFPALILACGSLFMFRVAHTPIATCVVMVSDGLLAHFG
jgi:MFS transporter, OPA family, solute carrier family 37 (glycerol-3-phosphate transporter), member 3